MKQLEYTSKNLYGWFKPEEVCFVVAKSYDYVNELSYITDDLNDALSFAKENDYKVFVYEKKFAKDCLNTQLLFRNMLDNIKEEEFDTDYVPNCIKKEGEKEFSELIEKWFDKYIGNTHWFADRLLGMLKIEEKQEKE